MLSLSPVGPVILIKGQNPSLLGIPSALKCWMLKNMVQTLADSNVREFFDNMILSAVGRVYTETLAV